MNDLISRQAAIDAFTGVVFLGTAQSAKKYIDGVITKIQNLPSAQPERKKGKWIFDNQIGTFKIWRCDQCGFRMEAPFEYCPYCGAEMSEGEEP